jgi:hypothetical protein
MFPRSRSFSVLYGIQRNFLAVFYLISVVAVFWLVFYLLHDIMEAGGGIIVPVSIAYLVIIVLGYSIVHVISYIPANLAGAFDPIKNGIASGQINSAADLSGKLAEFICSFFDFAFFDIQFAMVHLDGHKPVSYSEPDVDTDGLDFDELEKQGMTADRTLLIGKRTMGSGKRNVYVIPLIFGEKRLGYIAVATRQKLWKIFTQLLNEFENDFIDDQIVHVLAGETGALS